MASFNNIKSTLDSNDLNVTAWLTQQIETSTTALLGALSNEITPEDIEQAKEVLTKIQEKKNDIAARDIKMQSLNIDIWNARWDIAEITGTGKWPTQARKQIRDKMQQKQDELSSIQNKYTGIIPNPLAAAYVTPPSPLGGATRHAPAPTATQTPDIQTTINRLTDAENNYKNIIWLESNINTDDVTIRREPGTPRVIEQQVFKNTPAGATTYNLNGYNTATNEITLTDITIDNHYYPTITITNIDFDPTTGRITTAVWWWSTITPNIRWPIPITVQWSTEINRTTTFWWRNTTPAIQYNKTIHLQTNQTPEDNNILREPTEFDLSGRVGQDLRIDQHFYNQNGLPNPVTMDVFDTYPGATLNPPQWPGDRSVLYNIEVNGVTYQELRVQTDIVAIPWGTATLQVTDVYYIDRSGVSHLLEEWTTTISLPLRADFNGTIIDKNVNLTLDLDQANPLPPGLDEPFEVNLHDDLPKPSADVSFSHEWYDFTFTKRGGWTITQWWEEIYGKNMFDITQYTGNIAETGSVVAWLKTGIKEWDNNRMKGLKSARRVAKVLSWVWLGYEVTKKLGKWGTNGTINTLAVRNRMNRHMRRRMWPEAMSALYHGYFSHEYRMLDPDRAIAIEASGFWYQIHHRQITVYDAAWQEIAQEMVTSDAGQQIIRWTENQKTWVGYALTMAMRGDNRVERTFGERIQEDLFDNLKNFGRRATPHRENT